MARGSSRTRKRAQSAAPPAEDATKVVDAPTRQQHATAKKPKAGFWFEILGISIGVVALVFTAYQTMLATRALDDQRVANAWQILSIDGGGHNGKSYALNTLSERGERVVGLDLSCKLSDPKKCEADRPWIYGVDFTNAERVSRVRFDYAILEDVVFGAGLSDATLDGAVLKGVVFPAGGAGFSRIRMRNATVIDATFSGGVVTDIDFTGSDLTGLKFESTIQLFPASLNLSGVRFCREVQITNLVSEQECNSSLGRGFFEQAFFMEGNPPKDLDKLPGDFLIRAPCKIGAPIEECDANQLVEISSLR